MLETNSIAVAYAVLIINDISLLIDNAEIIFSMAQEGCGGSISSLYETNLKAQPYKGLLKSALRINQHLTGSYILQGSNVLINNKENIDLSTGIWELGRARETYDLIEKNITIRLNSPDADPIVQVDFDSSLDNPSLKSIYSIKTKNLTGMVYPSLAQDEIFWSLDIVNLTKALAGISSASTVRIEAMQSKGVLSKGSDRHLANHIEQLNDDIKRYSVRVLFPDYTLKNNTNMINSDFAAAYDQLQIIIEKLYYIITTEAIMTAQMMDLKKKENAPAQFTFGIGTTAALEALRTQVPFIEKENQFVKYINKAFQFIKSGELKKALMK
jgi:histidine ammonia-lyase